MKITEAVKARLEAYFRENFSLRGELGASLSIWHEGREAVSLAGGWADRQKTCPWTAGTPVLVWSCTKPLSAACVLHALARENIPLSTPVSDLWPEFKQSGKERITLAQALSHQAGLAALDMPAPTLDHAAVANALALQVPNWTPGLAHGYHPRTFGALLDEILRRADGTPGMTLGHYWQTHFAVPLGLDFWIGLPPEKVDAVSPVQPPKLTGTSTTLDPSFYQALHHRDTLTARAFASPRGLTGPASMNTPKARMACLPAFGGIGTARALAKFYAMLACGGALEGIRFFENTAPFTRRLTNGPDRVLLCESAFGAGGMLDPIDANGKKTRALFGPSLTAFGQPGSGGSIAFADPENGLSFAYVMNQMELGVFPTEKALGLIDALYA